MSPSVPLVAAGERGGKEGSKECGGNEFKGEGWRVIFFRGIKTSDHIKTLVLVQLWYEAPKKIKQCFLYMKKALCLRI